MIKYCFLNLWADALTAVRGNKYDRQRKIPHRPSRPPIGYAKHSPAELVDAPVDLLKEHPGRHLQQPGQEPQEIRQLQQHHLTERAGQRDGEEGPTIIQDKKHKTQNIKGIVLVPGTRDSKRHMTAQVQRHTARSSAIYATCYYNYSVTAARPPYSPRTERLGEFRPKGNKKDGGTETVLN